MTNTAREMPWSNLAYTHLILLYQSTVYAWYVPTIIYGRRRCFERHLWFCAWLHFSCRVCQPLVKFAMATAENLTLRYVTLPYTLPYRKSFCCWPWRAPTLILWLMPRHQFRKSRYVHLLPIYLRGCFDFDTWFTHTHKRRLVLPNKISTT